MNDYRTGGEECVVLSRQVTMQPSFQVLKLQQIILVNHQLANPVSGQLGHFSSCAIATYANFAYLSFSVNFRCNGAMGEAIRHRRRT